MRNSRKKKYPAKIIVEEVRLGSWVRTLPISANPRSFILRKLFKNKFMRTGKLITIGIPRQDFWDFQVLEAISVVQ